MRTLSIHNIVELLKPLITVNKFIKSFKTHKIANPITILAYHSISSHRNLKHARHYTIDPQIFDLQMNYLHDNDFKVINTAELYVMMQTQAEVESRTIVLTFDDGYADSFFNAFSVLKKYGLSATFFLIGSLVGSKNIFPWLRESLFPRGENRPLSAEQILEMAKGGMDFGSHSYSHQRLGYLSQEQSLEEIQRSKTHIEELLSREIKSFSYPYGSWNDFDRSHQEMVKKAGYGLAVTTIYGSNNKNSNPYTLRRISIYANDNLNTFAMKVKGHYDWIGRVQKILSLLSKKRSRLNI